ncbi:MAG: hypothetical protein M3Q36_01720 [bacterium]|nr:hypothetical protein [bacterium]
MFEYNFSTPKVTSVELRNVRLPQLYEVIVVNGVDENDYSSGQIGPLAVKPSPSLFDIAYTGWHYDFAQVQTHLTVEGSCRMRFSSMSCADLPVPERLSKLTPVIEENAAEIELVEGDLVIFHGGLSRIPVVHEARSLTDIRRSLVSHITVSQPE